MKKALSIEAGAKIKRRRLKTIWKMTMTKSLKKLRLQDNVTGDVREINMYLRTFFIRTPFKIRKDMLMLSNRKKTS